MYSARMEIACVFGFIEDATYQQLNIIREMRNACAHSKHAMVFSDPILANVAKRLFHPLGFIPQPEAGEDIKGAFLIEGILLFNTLLYGSRAAGKAVVIEGLHSAAKSPLPDTPQQQ